MKLLLDPALDLTDRGRGGLAALTKHHDTVPTQFGLYPDDVYNPATPMCDRCNNPLHDHLWMLLDDDNSTFDCETETR